MQNLDYVKGKLREWNKTNLGNLKVNKEKLCVELIDIDKIAKDDVGRYVELGVKRRDVLCSLDRNIKVEEKF